MASQECPTFEIQPLGENHLREAFSCGFDEIDEYIRCRALDDHTSHKVRIHAAVPPGEPALLGFYSLAIGALAPKTLPGLLKRKFGNRAIPMVYLAGIGVQEEIGRRGLGTALMLDAFEKTVSIADLAGTGCMTLDAVSAERARWYGDLQFEPYGTTDDGKIKMFIPLGTIQDALA